MRIQRRFTDTAVKPVDSIKYEIRKSKGQNAEVPHWWSQVATDILASKYFRKRGVPNKVVHLTNQEIREKFPHIQNDLALDSLPYKFRPSKPAPDAVFAGESSIKQVAHRLAGFWTFSGLMNNYFESNEQANIFYDEVYHTIVFQIAAPNSPQWFNSGLWWAYGITGPAQGHSYTDPDGEVHKSTDAYSRPALSACFIQSVNDDLVNPNGIMDLWVREARVFKYGGGSGTNFSKIRAKNEKLSGGGSSGGLMSFLKIGDRVGGSIKSGSTTRRAAKMVILNSDHPDIEEFVSWKVHEEQKVAALVTGSKAIKSATHGIMDACNGNYEADKNPKLKKAILKARELNVPDNYIFRAIELAKNGYKSSEVEIEVLDTQWEGEAYATVSGQNSNNSVRVTNEFMQAVADDAKWNLIERTTNKPVKSISAKKLWRSIGYSAWACADPGLQFDTTINDWHTCPNDEPINASNPCSEYMFIDDTACNLASINLVAVGDPRNGWSEYCKSYEQAIQIWTIVLDISVGSAQYPSDLIAKKSWQYRTLGLGYANLGALLMRLGIPYDSERACTTASALTAIMQYASYLMSHDIAARLGAFPQYTNNAKSMIRVIKNHLAMVDTGHRSFEGLSIEPKPINFSHINTELAEYVISLSERLELADPHVGFRNAQVTVIAPTGTIGLVMDCDTTGIEPDYALVKFKTLAGGGSFLIINESVPPALKNLGYSEAQIADITKYCLGTRAFDHHKLNRDKMLLLGITHASCVALTNSLPSLYDIEYLNLGLLDDESRKACNLNENSRPKDFFALFGLTSNEDIRNANAHICGTSTIEGAPHLKESDYPIFDCANKCGRNGKRFIRPLAHVDMMAAVQPLISGAISKTINMPSDATVEDVLNAYYYSWRKMIKAVALYRDNSKLSQPLQSGDLISVVDDAAMEVAKEIKRHVAVRRNVPWRRSGYTQKVRFGGHTLYVTTGEYEDGQLGEVFLTMAKEGSAFRGLLNAFAVAVSIGLQHGVPLDEFCKAYLFNKFEPNGVVQGHDKIKMTSSMVDFIFRDLAIAYLGQHDLAHTNKITIKDLEVDALPKTDSDHEIDFGIQISANGNGKHHNNNNNGATLATLPVNRIRMPGYEGEACPDCHSLTMVRNGTCLKCAKCGATSGCS